MGASKLLERTILIVDDEADFRDVLAMTFKAMGYNILTAANGRDAFDMLQVQHVDVVISDIRMPGGDGIEFLDRARERSPLTPVILLVTGYAEVSTADAHDKGAEALFAKPFKMRDVKYAIDRLLESPTERWSRPEHSSSQHSTKLHFQDSKAEREAKVLNIGRGGMFVCLDDAFPLINDNVTFNISFEGGVLSGSGIVRWIRTRAGENLSAGCGIEFTFLSDSQRQQVIQIINEKKPKAFIPKG